LPAVSYLKAGAYQMAMLVFNPIDEQIFVVDTINL